MTIQISQKEHYIDLFRRNGFNCFPIPENQKVADHRYQAAKTRLNQPIREKENYGYIPIMGTGNAIIDLDHKERYRSFAEHMINKGYMVIETPHGWHIPVTGLNGNVTKIELFDYSIQDKKIIEIQGTKHYCVGAYSKILDSENQCIFYENKGTEKIWNAHQKDFHNFVDELCIQCKVEPRKKSSRSSYKSMRDRFLKGLIPTTGTSNDYFFQAAKQCNSDGLSQTEALDKIKSVYDKWIISDQFSNRPISNIEAKIQEVYEKNLRVEEGRPTGSTIGLDRTGLAQEIIAQRKLYSDVETNEIFENKQGFLERINDNLKRELVTQYPQIELSDYNAILFKLVGLAEKIPDTNKERIVFKNGVYDKVSKSLIESDDLADMGFQDYNYLESTEENKPTKFLKIMFDNVNKSEHKRINAGLRATLSNYLDPKISVLHGAAGVGKSTPLLILVKTLGVYAMAVELDQLLQDRFIRAKIKGKRLLVLQDLPQDWKDFTQIKTMTGEQVKSERGFMQDMKSFDNKLKIWASGNYLSKIPSKEKNAMYSRRLSLIHNTKTESYDENPSLVDDIVKEEGEKIISWILNLTDKECQYEDSKTVRKEWEDLASPEIKFLQDNFELSGETNDVPIMKIIHYFMEKTGKFIDIPQMSEALQSQGYVIKYNIIKNLSQIIKKTTGLQEFSV